MTVLVSALKGATWILYTNGDVNVSSRIGWDGSERHFTETDDEYEASATIIWDADFNPSCVGDTYLVQE